LGRYIILKRRNKMEITNEEYKKLVRSQIKYESLINNLIDSATLNCYSTPNKLMLDTDSLLLKALEYGKYTVKLSELKKEKDFKENEE